jgi:hypothetical protein
LSGTGNNYETSPKSAGAAPITAGQLDGSPGVYVGAAADVNVAGFTIEGAALPTPRTVK